MNQRYRITTIYIWWTTFPL